MKKKTVTLPYLPHDLIIYILMTLPVKSLIRFKCVCKFWFSLISDPKFADSHFELTSATHTHRILSISSCSPLQIRSIDFESSRLNNHCDSLFNFSLPPDIRIRGSCRGFIYLQCSSNIYLCNPSTGLYKQIPLSPFDTKLIEHRFDHLYGFGYDRSRDDYLVVSLSYDPTVDYISPNFEFFSLRDNTWKQIEMDGAHYYYIVSANDHRKLGVLFNGAIHWLAYCYELKMFVIVAFDLMERKLLDIPLPYDFHHQHAYSGLWVSQEFLSLWATKECCQYQMWLMKDSKLHSSWTKTLLLRTNHNSVPNFSPICSAKNGDIIGTDGATGLVKYNDKGKLLQHRSNYNNSVGSKGVLCTESLLSLPGDREQEDDTNKNEVLKYSPSPFS